MKLAHVSVTARDADRLAAFDRSVFGCQDRRPPRLLSGAAVSRGNGLPNSQIYSIWLRFPDSDTPFLELLEYKSHVTRAQPRVDDPGLGHLSFEVDDVAATLAAVLAAGGTAVGEITNFGTDEKPVPIVYVRDCEGNILELEQTPA